MGSPGPGPRALWEMGEEGSIHADVAQSSPVVSHSCNHQVPSGNSRGWGGIGTARGHKGAVVDGPT